MYDGRQPAPRWVPPDRTRASTTPDPVLRKTGTMAGRGGRGRCRALGFVAAFVSLMTVLCSTPQAGAAPSAQFGCTVNPNGYITGADGTAGAMGWAGNQSGVVACLGGSFYLQDGINRSYEFGIYAGNPTTWTNASGWLPALVTRFPDGGTTVTITEFVDRVVLGGHPFALLYARVAVRNPTSHPVTADPAPSPGLVALASVSDRVAPGRTAVHDYVIAADRFGGTYPWPSVPAMQGAGSFAAHFAHMLRFWVQQVSTIAQIEVPDRSLVDAYRSGFVYTQISRSGTHLDTGVNGYQSEFSHDVIGILANLFTQGDYRDAHALLLEMRSVVGSNATYVDGLWTYSWPWALYLMKTGDLAFVRANFAAPGPDPSTEPSIEQTAHLIGADRTGPGGIMEATDDIDTNGYWTIDDYEALMGLAAYRYLAQQVGSASEVQWATQQYDSLLAATNTTLEATVTANHLSYLPCSMLQPNTANRCANPEDANWAAPFLFGRWAWDAPLFGASTNGPGVDLIDSTYTYGFTRLRGLLPANTFGGYPDDWYSTAYNAGYGEWGLAGGPQFRSQGIESYAFMIQHSQSGPLSWWESASPPAASPWVGSHPGSGQGSSPHAWGMANANMVLLDSLVTMQSNGTLIVGRGIPDAWLTSGRAVTVANFPTTAGHRVGVRITSAGRTITLMLSGTRVLKGVKFELPAFVDNVATTSQGRVEEAEGSVAVSSSAHVVRVQLRHGVP